MKCCCPCGELFKPNRRNQKFVNAIHREVARNLRRPRVRVPADSAALLRARRTRREANSAVGTTLPGTQMAETQRDRIRARKGRQESSEFLSSFQVARLLGISTWALVRQRREGKGPRFVKLGRCTIRYRSRDLEAWLDSLSSRTV
jgi:predicted DNA-binding transcriptional regulator AlpA